MKLLSGYFEGTLPDEGSLSAFLAGGRLPESVVDGGAVSDLPSEGYVLDIEAKRIVLRYADPSGAFYGMQTLRQLLRSGRVLHCRSVRDWPDLPVRGFMLDISRSKVPTMATLRSLVELMASLKLNQLQLYTEHTFAYKGHEEVWKDASPITPEELRELDDICRSRAVELVANQNSFGHMRPWLSLAKYRHLAEAPDGFEDPWGAKRDYPYSLTPVVPETIDLLDDLYSQLLPNVRSEKFNVGCDETFDLGQGRSKELCDRIGKGKVYFDFLMKIHALVGKHGKRMLFWADIVQQHPETIDRLPKDSVAIEWGYEADHPFDDHCLRLSQAGLEFYVAPGTSTWNSVAGRWGVARENIAGALGAARRFGARGMLLTEWGDNGYLQPFVTMAAPLAYAAGGAWNSVSLLTEPWLWLSRHYLREDSSAPGREPGPLASSLRMLAELYRLHPANIPNASIFGVALVLAHMPKYARSIDSFTGECRRKTREALAVIDLLIEECGRGDMKETLALREVRFARRLIGLANDLLDGRPPDSTVAGEILREHETLWLERFRPGGLQLSRAFLEQRLGDSISRG